MTRKIITILTLTALALAPAFGIMVGTVASRLDRLAMRADRYWLVVAGRWVASWLSFALFVGSPVVIGLAVAIGCHRSGLP